MAKSDPVVVSEIVEPPVQPVEPPKNSNKQLPSVRVVVAHYNESLKWIEAIPKDYAITISYSGEEPQIPSRVSSSIQIKQTPNGGKDCGQWIRWIAEHYDELDDIMLFLQGNPYTGHTSEILLQIGRNNLKNIFDYFGSVRPFHKSVGKGWQYGELTWIVPAEFHVRPFSCGVWGSQHYVTKAVIHRRPKSFYERLAGISLELGGSKFGDICEHFFNVIYGVTIDEVI
jgi:hypothetical protein